ncbi:hypothetical protein AtNW77_Chr2g0263491 [Arabidopsis thaliana]|uniref:Uncharacterized protein n=2 Tax=Arabidopsis thaliana TaxID=3702 RepID=A0A654F0V4_ARATH|nr:uncharacterized protein AT2G41417 [Arabidopsis thaliana]ANM62217.1 hypothetical protein AT2G41417 [Arabidopsis thaliana]CAA0376157.1 unnamed protein product [Arabidopsis thaliana]VYS55177.1 unnamed protein product [Arabidopsis thaliana]|eukprot:NP_001324392.1 hypothetical protein AT2G41417 [Arabidopsis thaliana]
MATIPPQHAFKRSLNLKRLTIGGAELYVCPAKSWRFGTAITASVENTTANFMDAYRHIDFVRSF